MKLVLTMAMTAMTQRQRDGLETEARALGTPTRFRIFSHIADAGRPVGVAELTDLLGFNHNAIRQHLAVLKDAGLVLEHVERRHRVGRPRVMFNISPEARGSWGTPGPYADLAVLLSESVRAEDGPRGVGRRAGERRGAVLAESAPDANAAIAADLAASGFRPAAARTSKDRTEFVLGRCPYVEVAAVDPTVVCDLHLGLAEGIAAAFGHEIQVSLTPRDARRAGCRLSVSPVHASGTQG